MKKLFITIAFVAAAMFAQAQFFVGGSLGLTSTSAKETEKIGNVSSTFDGEKQFTFNITPSVGFMFNENMGVGLDFGIDLTNITYPKGTNGGWGVPVAADETLKIKQTSFLIAPYFRYVFAEIDNFKFYADARISYMSAKPKLTISSDNQTTEYTGYKVSKFGIGIVPGMAYMLTDNISMNCQLNVLSLYFTSTSDTVTDTDYEDTVKTNEFGFGINEATPIKIGFFYTF